MLSFSLSVTVVGGEPRKCEQSKFTSGAQKKGVDEAFPSRATIAMCSQKLSILSHPSTPR